LARASEFEELQRYLRALPRYEPLTREDEVRLANRVRRGERSAREELIKRNLPFVVAIAKRNIGRGARLDDLIQEGNLGLMRAVEKFDTSRGTRFSTYAIWWIRAYIQKYLKEAHSMVRGGEDAARRGLKDVSLDLTIDEDGEVSALDRIPDDGAGPELEVVVGDEGDHVRDRLERVKERIGPLGWDIVNERFRSDDPQTLEQIGKRWGVSRERVRQVELKTRVFLKRYLADFRDQGESEAA
jgi:RNA polymerase primary sigma factor